MCQVYNLAGEDAYRPGGPFGAPRAVATARRRGARRQRLAGGGRAALAGAREDLLEAGLDAWSRRHLDLEAEAPEEVAGDALLHLDLRADNLLVTPQGRVLVVDWPHARVGASWLDPVFFAPSVAMQRGLDTEEMLARHPAGRRADPAAVTAALAAVAGFFSVEALRPAPPGLPTLRPFQAAQGEAVRAWLTRRTGWR